MCGIVGIWNESNEPAVAAMARRVAHRGPDGLHFTVHHGHSVGASRLAIFGDPEAPAMFRDPDTDIVVLLNGEIYNYQELRMGLEGDGVVFRTDLESEVVAKLYERSCLGFATRLKGMFAIAILDGDRLILARDGFGIKPLYYCELGPKVVFGSEVKAILAYPGIPARLDLESLEEITVFGYSYSPKETLFQGICQVEPGTLVVFEPGERSVSRYKSLPRTHYLDEVADLPYPEAVARLRELMIGSLDLLLSHGRHEVGLYLSGGLDSTTLAIIARSLLNHPVMTFTLTDGTDGPDTLAAREVARKLGTDHVEVRATHRDYMERLDHFVAHYESIVAGGVFDIHGGMAFHLLSEAVSQHVKVAFSGEGADELFGGYYWIYTHPLGFADRIRARLDGRPIRPELRELVDSIFPYPENESIYRRNAMDSLAASGLANYHLQSVDRSAGAFGFEVRPAYLFDDIAEFALSLPIEYKVPDKATTKHILRDAFRPEFECLGLDWVLKRQKEGMPAAISGLSAAINETMESCVSDTESANHPLRAYFGSKMDLYLFDLFSRTFGLEPVHAPLYCSA